MMNITISFDNTLEAIVAINAVRKFNEGIDDSVKIDVADTTSTPTESAKAGELTPTEIQGVIDALTKMDNSELEDMFGTGNDKPYRVIKNVGFKAAKEKLGDNAVSEIEIASSLDDVNKAIDLIVKDVSDGGLSHNDFEEMFDVRTSKKLFMENDLDEIVTVLKANGFIA